MSIPPPQVAEIIRRKKMKYGRLVDTKQWSRFTEIALPSARLAFFNPDMVPMKVGKQIVAFDSLEKYTGFISRGLAMARSIHIFGSGELEQTAPDEVKAIFSMEDEFRMNNTLGLAWSRGAGFYYETWKKRDDDWFLADLRLERNFVKSSLLFLFFSLIADVTAFFGINMV
jgi:hypothetical protein